MLKNLSSRGGRACACVCVCGCGWGGGGGEGYGTKGMLKAK